MEYCVSHHKTARFKTREVMVGKVGVGGSNPIRIQSMTTSSTRDVDATIEQAIRLADFGCEIVRVTVQGIKEAESCEEIKNGLLKRGYDIPLVADIHFYPPAALKVADSADKVRINPGNFADKRATFKILQYNEATYQAELDRIEEVFLPLIEKCKKLKKSLRIGTNHGSLSDRIMNYYGDTPRGMVESAFEYARVCRKYDFHDIIFSMKASNPLVMIQAYRLIVAEMMKLGWDYPLHLGVTEAGEGEDGRVKSAIGIGSLLLDGIGDTIRVSLTEDPWYEIDPCKRLVSIYEQSLGKGIPYFPEKTRNFMGISRARKEVKEPLHPDGTVLDPSAIENPTFVNGDDPLSWNSLLENTPAFVLLTASDSRLHKGRRFVAWAKEKNLKAAILFAFDYSALSAEDLVLMASAECGSLLADGLGDGLALKTSLSKEATEALSLNILQGARMRATKTEYISCPGCGRTLFDLQTVSRKIKEKTSHLAGVKIAIMGCIVNGPGEMADADFGYVGSKTGMIDLYVGKECVQRNIPFHEADEKLIVLIKEHGRWMDPVDKEEELCTTATSS
jgi:(E)-4-hydroxy-3-methylbut-2-enyl-diphosphate synthase